MAHRFEAWCLIVAKIREGADRENTDASNAYGWVVPNADPAE
jgi:hypothetical protein